MWVTPMKIPTAQLREAAARVTDSPSGCRRINRCILRMKRKIKKNTMAKGMYPTFISAEEKASWKDRSPKT